MSAPTLPIYAGPAEMEGYGFKVDPDKDLPVLNKIAPRASRIFDQVAKLPPGYFGAVASDAPATQQTFYGDGTDYLFLPPYIPGSIPTDGTGVVLPSLYAQQQYTERTSRDGDQMLVRKYPPVNLDLMNPNLWQWSAYRDPMFGPTDFSNRNGWIAGVEVKVKAVWGFAATPEDVVEAAIEIMVAIWRGKDPAFAKVIAVDGATTVMADVPGRAKLIAQSYAQRARRIQV